MPQQQVSSALNLAGLSQTGALPFPDPNAKDYVIYDPELIKIINKYKIKSE